MVGVLKPDEGPLEKNESTEDDETDGCIVESCEGVRKLSSTIPGEPVATTVGLGETTDEPPVKKQYWLTKSEYETPPRLLAPALGMLRLGSYPFASGNEGGLMGLSDGVPPLEAVMLGVELWLSGLSRSPPALTEDDEDEDEPPYMFRDNEGGASV